MGQVVGQVGRGANGARAATGASGSSGVGRAGHLGQMRRVSFWGPQVACLEPLEHGLRGQIMRRGVGQVGQVAADP